MRLILLSIFFVFLPLQGVLASGIVPQISVFGVAEKEVVPDEMRWVLLVRTEGNTPAEVSKEHVREVSAVLSLLLELGQAKESVATDNMQLNEQWVYHSNSRRKEGYFASTSIRFVSNDFTTYVDYWTRLAALGSVSVSNVVFHVSKRSEIEDEVKVAAIENAQEKAIKFAAALDTTIDLPLRIEEMDTGNFSPRRLVRSALMESDGGGQPVSPGKQLIHAKVKVVFSLQ